MPLSVSCAPKKSYCLRELSAKELALLTEKS
jgi:hypothetical protein